MIPSKFKPLASDSSEESDESTDGPAVTKEALEQEAMSKYQKALSLENKGKWSKAEHVLRELLKSDILVQAKGRITGNSNGNSTMMHLRYCVTLNLGNCFAKQEKLKESLNYYVKASKLDSTDLNLWYKIGLTALKLPDLYLASNAFEEGLRCNPNHWPCIDNLVTVYYALGDLLSCLYYSHKGVTMDCGFVKGFAFKEKIFGEIESFKEDFALYYPKCKFPSTPTEIEMNSSEVKKMYDEAVSLRERETGRWETIKVKIKEPLMLPEPVRLDSWERITKCLLLLLEIAEKEGDFIRPIVLSVKRECSSPVSIIVADSDPEEEELETGKEDEDEENGKNKANGQLIEKLMVQNQKRRSARVRSTARREEPSLSSSFSLVIPSYLMPKDFKKNVEGWSDDSLHTMDLYRLYKEGEDCCEGSNELVNTRVREEIIEDEGYFNTQKELDDVEDFKAYTESEKHGIVIVLQELVFKLALKWKLQWPDNLGKLYVKAYKAVLKYIPATVICQDDPTTFAQDCSVLLYGELLLKQWLAKGRNLGVPSPLGESWLGGDYCSLYLGRLAYRADMTEDLHFFARCFWLEALLLYYCRDSEPAAMALQKILSDDRCDCIQVRVPNVSKHAVINKNIVTKLLKSFRRNKSLAEVVDLYSSGYYEEVCETISDSLKADTKDVDSDDQTLSRLMQYALILDSLWKLTKYEECIVWSEACLYEALNEYRKSNDDERTELAEILIKVMTGIISCIDQMGYNVIQHLRHEKQSRLIQTLSGIINYQLEAPEGTVTMPIETVAPWIILHYILKHDSELNNGEIKRLSDSLEEEEVPSWVQILFVGHDYLGRRSWCCFDEGSLLFHTLKVVQPMVQALPFESKSLAKITQNVEQIFYCLYGQEKKSKGRHLVSHNSLGTNLGLALTWNRAQQVFQFMRPRFLPAYDTTGKCIVTPDQEALFVKLIECVPPELNPGRLVPELNKYINGQVETVPVNDKALPDEICDIYYLLGHYYFKNKTWTKAVKHFLLDLCTNPSRVDSWACLALARGSESETTLNSCETIKNVTDFLKRAARVCRSFEKSLQLDPAQSTLWIERGTFSYSIHSYCSNILKKNQDLSLEMYQMLEDKKTAMIEAANQCFIKANQLWYATGGADYVIDERWLHHYMLGKIAKKRDEDASVYITHYLKAIELLNQIGANYPALINHAAPQLLSVESLELYYRVHATILKSLEEYEDKPLPPATAELFKSAINQLEQSPFILQVKIESKVEKKPRSLSSLSDDDLIVVQEAEGTLADIIVRVENINDSSLKRKSNVLEPIPEEPPTKVVAIANEIDGGESRLPPSRRSTVTSESNEGSKMNLETASDKGISSSTSTGTNKGSSSSSTSSSSDSSSDSSDSSSSSSSTSSTSSSSSSSSSNSGPDTKKVKLEPIAEENPVDSLIKEQEWMTDRCLEALETCHKRFTEHYKTLYNLAHYYFKSKKRKSLERVQQLLLGPGGLFGDRKPTNFFNGVWRIPQNEIDRPGSFAAHMGRCVILLLDVLAEAKDYKMLIELAIQLKVVPEADKKYLRDNEREELCKEAAVHGAQVLRKKLQDYKPESAEQGKEFLLEVYQIYRRINKSGLKDTMYASILTEAYNKFTKETNHTLDAAIRFCAGEIAIQKQQVTPNITTVPISSLMPPVTTKPPTAPENLAILTEVVPPIPLPKRGRPPGPRKVRDPNEPRKPRGRPPNSSLGPRLPNPAQLYGSQSSAPPSLVPPYMQLPSDLLIRHLKDFKNISASVTPAPLTLPSSLSVTKGASSNIDSATPLLKDRPSLSITPVNKPLTSSGPRSPSSHSQPPVSTAAKVSKTFGNKRSLSPLLSTTTSSKTFTATNVTSALQKVSSPNQIRSNPSLTSMPIQIFPAHSNPASQPTTSTAKVDSRSQMPPTLPSMPTSSAISISPINPLPPPPKKFPIQGLPLSITPKSPLTTHSYPDVPKTYPAPSPLLHSLPQSVPMQTSHQAVSLQHKLLAKKMSQPKIKSEPPLPVPQPVAHGKVPRPAHESSYHPVTKTSSDMPMMKPPLTSKSSIYSSLPPPAHPASTKFSSNVMKKLPDSLMILPTGSNREHDPSPSAQHVMDSRLNILTTVPNLDHGVAEAIKSFGSSITITAAKTQKTSYSQEASASAKKPSTKEEGKSSKNISEVIVLDD